MTKPQLDRVTMIAFDGGQCPELTALAVDDSMDQVDFGAVVVCAPEPIPTRHNCDFVKKGPWPDRYECTKFQWYEIPEIVQTEFFLLVHYDAWILDGSLWEQQFLDYDYMGAPWWYDDLNVGHGTLRSIRLMRFLAENRNRLPIEHPEDNVLSRRYRPALEEEGFRWPTEQVASRFMLECTRPSLDSKHFMFHDVFNFPAVLTGERLEQRLDLVYSNRYIRKKTDKIKQLEFGRRAEIMPRLVG